jgi:hypothetical protein
VERLLETDPGAAAYAEFLRGFYDRLDEEEEREIDSRVEAFVDDLFESAAETVISVQPFQPPREARPTVLAAETTASRDERRYSVLATLAAEAQQMLVRIVKDRDTGRGRLYVLADPPSQRAHVVVSFPDFGLDLVVDDEGRRSFDLPSEIDAEQWDEARALVRRPVAAGAVEPGSTTTMDLSSGGTLHGRWHEDMLTVWLETDETAVPSFLAATSPDTSPHLLRLQTSSPVQCSVEGEHPLALRLYE